MKKKRIKVFLGGYVNATNAQNLNCRSLALHLDKNQFDVGVMIYPGGSLPIGNEFQGVKQFRLLCKLYRPLRWVRYINYLRGLLWCDVAYLPKGEIYAFTQKCAKLLKKKTFITVEGVIDKETYQGMLKLCSTDDGIRKLYSGYDKSYSITDYMSRKNNELLDIKSDGILYLGVETSKFAIAKRSQSKTLSDVIFIGNDLKRKRVNEFIELARLFPNISFHIAGGHPEFSDTIRQTGLTNIIFHGCLSHEKLSELLSKMDLHIFTSRSEGFPKVTLETAAAGVPSIVYGDYGAAEWITTGKDGFVVDKFEEIVDIVADLKKDPEKLAELSYNAIKLAEHFDWQVLIKDWEEAIINLFSVK